MGNNFKTKTISNKETSNIIIKIINILTLILIIFIIFIIFIYISYGNFKDKTINNEEIIIEVERNDTLYSIGNTLNLNETFFKYYIKNNVNDFQLNSGKYKIEKNSTIKSIFTQLEKPIYNEINITVLEGWNIFDIDDYLTKKSLINKGEYISYTQNQSKINELQKFFPFIEGVNTLEGFLYPDTYKINKDGFAINKLVIKQLNNFELKVYNKLFLDQGKQKYDNKIIYDVINLASIVEKEEKNKKEKSTVAGILKKRLNSGWMIGADITVCYPHKLTANECKMVITKYINEKSEYNTRTMTGLPKTPIGNPSYETISATLNDKKTKYWYYLHDTKTGKIYYGVNNEDHTKNKRLYLR